MTTEFIELAGQVNQQMPYHCVARVERALNDAGQAGARRRRSPLLGVSYKAGVGDVRESPALKIIALLRALGADVVYHDDVRARAARRGPARRAARRGARRRRPRGDRHRASGHRPRAGRGGRAVVLDLRGVTRGVGGRT